MSAQPLEVAPVLSTPDTHIFEDPTPPVDIASLARLSNEQLLVVYEVERTVREIRASKWRRIALQFPDEMLMDAPRVFEALARGLSHARNDRVSSPSPKSSHTNGDGADGVSKSLESVSLSEDGPQEKLFILADTSYGACCVDEIAAEHVDADVVVHYGRSCLSPTARLPVIYVFTTRPLALDLVFHAFKETYQSQDEKVILMADIPYSNHITPLLERLRHDGYSNLFAAQIIHDPSSPLPNRSVPADVKEKAETLRDYQLFHISDPPQSLLLTLSSRVGAIHIYPTDSKSAVSPKALLASSAATLRRRYALLTRLSTVSIFGILINTLSVKNYIHILNRVKEQIAAAGKKSYTFVVGKVNAAKVANFSEVGGWVVIGCWESSLIEGKDFWKPIITPFELSLALKGDAERVWTGEWTGDFQAVLTEKENAPAISDDHAAEENGGEERLQDSDIGSEEESAPPEFDLRTGRYVSHSRPMQAPPSRSTKKASDPGRQPASSSLMRRANGDLAQVGGVVSPAAEFLRNKRTWQGLGSDFEIAYDEPSSTDTPGALMELGRSGIARGYAVGGDRSKT
ncbi:diphthamide biosynthesis protein 2 [Coniosporium apollinis CBS 100218]|uniref:2-(3-amino-3-carboxypropyl)histidine synthase subunit 2 n=1 Tax=Coniosporium apollinis (strain CBS 100218) TaxID=1168221 RepID=R7Z532_CONA1|nr:diphthamide biosynthesis protein 2 [Coniosporium apollinis CBS 100218]EON69282.1 diphthamide biosynthesis protein 2 [Coniosporium apollinis CBS 100218]